MPEWERGMVLGFGVYWRAHVLDEMEDVPESARSTLPVGTGQLGAALALSSLVQPGREVEVCAGVDGGVVVIERQWQLLVKVIHGTWDDPELTVDPDVGMVAILASRTIAFWLPLPLGLLAFWDLKRRHCL